MRPVDVLIFHAPTRHSGPREDSLARARSMLAEEHRRRFLAAGADAVRVISEPPDHETSDTEPFGDRLRRAFAPGRSAADRPSRSAADRPGHRPVGGIVVLGSGALPLARTADLRRFVVAAAGSAGHVVANNRFSADAFAIADASVLESMPPLRSDNELPRWLAGQAGVEVCDLREHWRLQVDLDSPLDVVLAARDPACPAPLRSLAETILQEGAPVALRRALSEVSRVMADPGGELVVVGRTSVTTLRWLESHARCRVRAIVEERGLRAAGSANRRPPRSLLGQLLDLEGPEALARRLAELGDAAIVDTRVLMAHRLGADERTWPAPEDRFASDLLDPPAIADPWLQALTRSATEGGLPILLGGHSLVGPEMRLLGSELRRPTGAGPAD